MISEIAAAPPGNLVWRSVWKLLKLRLTISVGGFRRASLRGKISYIFLALVGIGILWFAYFISTALLGFMRSPDLAAILGDTRPLLEAIPVLIISAAFIGILLTSFGLLLQALYLAGDMDFLLSMPISMRAVFLAKLIQAILPNFALILLFGLPVLYGLGATEQFNIVYYPLVLLNLGVFALAGAGVASLLVLAVVRIFPARRVAEVLGFVVGISSFICSQSGQFANWDEVSADQIANLLQRIEIVTQPWSPFAWAGRGLLAAGQGQWLPAFAWMGLVLIFGTGIFWLSLETAERLYYTGWASLQVQNRRRRKPTKQQSRAGAFAGLVDPIIKSIPAPIRALLNKDFLVLRRDLRNLSQLSMPLVLGVVYTALLLRNGGPGRSIPATGREALDLLIQNLSVYANVGIALFVSWTLITRLALIGFSQEGKSYWLVKAAPLKTLHLVLAKYLVVYLPATGLSVAFLIVIAFVRGSTLGVFGYGLSVILFLIAGMTGITLAFGISTARFDWDDPRRMQGGGAGCLATLITLVFVGIGLLVFFLPPVFLGVLNLEWLGRVVGLIFGGGLSLIGAFVPLWWVRRRVPNLME